MDLFDEKNIQKVCKDQEKLKDFATGKLNIQVFSSSDPNTFYDSLVHVKYLFQRMLPKMPRDYILRQVFDENHCCMTLNEKIEGKDELFRIIGAVLFRPCFERKLVEIVFLAVDSEYHVSGYGTFLFNCFKEICKLLHSTYFKIGDKYKDKNLIITDLSIFEDIDKINIKKLMSVPADAPDEDYIKETPNTNLYLLTYADNSAIGFFKKQGFSLQPKSTEWIGYIKDYEGGTLMECKIHKEINYLQKIDLFKKARDLIFQKMAQVNDFHILRDASEREDIIKRINTNSETRTKEKFLNDFLYFLICTLQSHPSSWPFLEPVSEKDVPDYFVVITKPMDMSLIMRKLKAGAYFTLKEFSEDIYLMCNNCFTYNAPETQYYKCADNIQLYYKDLLQKYAEKIHKWGYDAF